MVGSHQLPNQFRFRGSTPACFCALFICCTYAFLAPGVKANPQSTNLLTTSELTILYKDLGADAVIGIRTPDKVVPNLLIDVNQNGTVDKEVDTYYSISNFNFPCNGYLVNMYGMDGCGSLVSKSTLRVSHSPDGFLTSIWIIPKTELSTVAGSASFVVWLVDTERHTSQWLPSTAFSNPYRLTFGTANAYERPMTQTQTVQSSATPQQPSQSDAEKFAEARVAMANHDCAVALRALEGYSEPGRNDPLWVLQIAKAEECVGDTAEALKYYRKYDKIVPGQAEIAKKLGELNYKRDKEAEAEEKLKQEMQEAQGQRIKEQEQRMKSEEQQRWEEEDAKKPAWVDPATKLMWARHDNGSNINQKQARDYCINLRLLGFNGWRLPTIEELQTVYDPTLPTHMKGMIQPSEIVLWSSTPGQNKGYFVQLMLPGGGGSGITSHPWHDTLLNRALCVRQP